MQKQMVHLPVECNAIRHTASVAAAPQLGLLKTKVHRAISPCSGSSLEMDAAVSR